MKKALILLLMVLLVFVTAGCNNSQEDGRVTDNGENVIGDTPSANEDQTSVTVTDFSLIAEKGTLTIGEWDYVLNPLGFLGTSHEENVIELENADTFNGCWEKTQIYDRLTLVWFSPKDNGETYWLEKVMTTNADFTTNRGIKVGSQRSEMEAAYPEISQVLDGRTDPDNCAWQWTSENNYDYGYFEVQNGVIVQITLERVLP